MNCPSCQHAIEGSPAFCPSCGTPLPRDLPPDPLIGRTLAGRFKILKLLGEGGMGAVYVGEQMLGTTARKVAIKTLHSHLSRDPSVRARFNREVGTLAGLQHPNTVQVFDFGTTDDGLLYIAMEFIQGRSLSDILEKEGPMKPERVLHIVSQICGSLAEAHAQGIIHRDLKPDNIVISDRVGQKDVVKVLDFGIAKRSGEEDKNEPKLTQQGMVLGTPPYMSPEQFTGQPLDARSDIYSLAVMIYELLTGHLPFEAGSAWEWATLHMTAAPKAIEAQPNGALLPESMRGAIMKALAKDRSQRFASVNEFLDRFSGKTPATAMEMAQRQPTAAFGPNAPAGGTASAGPLPQPPTPVPFAPAVSGMEQKGKTQIGDVIALPPDAFSPGPPMMAPYQSPAANPYGAHSYATPGGVAQQPYAPSSGGGGGSNRGMLIGIIAVIAVLSAGALGFGFLYTGGSSTAKTPPVVPTDITPTTPTPTPTDTQTTGTTDPTPTPAPLTPGHTTPVTPAHPPANPPANPPAHPPTNPPANPPANPPVNPNPPVQPPPAQPPPVQPPPAQPPPVQPPPVQPPPVQPPHAEPAVCLQAKAFPDKNSPTYKRLASQCRAAGGTP